MNNWFTYVLLCDQKTFYVGITNNIERRFLEHIKKYSPYTKKFSDLRLIYYERYAYRQEAEKREKQLKGWSKTKKKALIKKDYELLKELSKSPEYVE